MNGKPDDFIERKKVLIAHRQASVVDLARHFEADVDAIRGMLAHFIQKGRSGAVTLAAYVADAGNAMTMRSKFTFG
jgi:hypothetical protein